MYFLSFSFCPPLLGLGPGCTSPVDEYSWGTHPNKTVEKPTSESLMGNVHPAGFAAGRNWGPAHRVGSPSEARTNPEE
jgi:hypothetical protein